MHRLKLPPRYDVPHGMHRSNQQSIWYLYGGRNTVERLIAGDVLAQLRYIISSVRRSKYDLLKQNSVETAKIATKCRIGAYFLDNRLVTRRQPLL